jgi:hypothetical protein
MLNASASLILSSSLFRSGQQKPVGTTAARGSEWRSLPCRIRIEDTKALLAFAHHRLAHMTTGIGGTYQRL